MKKSCESFLEADRLNINKHFWSLGYSGRKSFILERVNRHTVQRRSISREVNKKNASLKYAFRRPDGSVLEVCKTFFLGTLGMAPNNHTIITKTFKKIKSDQPTHIDGRGQHPC